ncbi:hypothetical protein MYXO_00308 [Myxococcaceae bacterium]|jgi:hypothetical protein|nr:hypothetical protein MYXO_00308 [Myxococcaceae bacterium]
MSEREILDPTDERRALRRRPATRPARLEGPVGLVDIAKARGDVFLDEIERLLRQRDPGLEIVRLAKPTFTKPAPQDLRDEITRRCRTVIQALAD